MRRLALRAVVHTARLAYSTAAVALTLASLVLVLHGLAAAVGAPTPAELIVELALPEELIEAARKYLAE